MNFHPGMGDPSGGSRRLLILTAVIVMGLSAGWVSADDPKPVPPLAPERQQRLQERDRYGQEMKKLKSGGRLPEAIAAAEKMLAIERDVFGDIHEDVAGSLAELAVLHETRGDFAAGRKARLEVLEIETKLHGLDHWKTADARFKLAYNEKLAELDPKRRQILIDGKRDFDKAVQFRVRGQFREAVPILRAILETHREILGKEHRSCELIASELAVSYQSLGELEQAEPLFQEALASAKKTVGERHPSYAYALLNLANFYREKGDFVRAESLGRAALKLDRELLGSSHGRVAVCLNHLAEVYKEMGAYHKAEPFYQEALKILKTAVGANSPLYARCLNNLAVLYRTLGDYAKAEALYRQVLAIAKKEVGERHPFYATSLSNLGILYLTTGDYQKAEPLFQEAVTVTKKWLGEKHPNYAAYLENLAELYRKKGDFAQAERHFQEVLNINRDKYGERHYLYAKSLNNLAMLHVSTGAYAKAEPLFQQALGIAEEALGGKHPNCATLRTNLGFLYQATGDMPKALAQFAQALSINEENTAATFAVLGERQRLQLLGSRRRSLRGYLGAALASDPVPVPDLYRHVLAWKGTVASRQSEDLLVRDEPGIRPLVEELTAARFRLARLAFAVPPPQGRQAWLDGIDKLSRQREDLETRLANASAAFRRERELVRLGPADVLRALPGDAALIDFFEYGQPIQNAPKGSVFQLERHLLAFVLTPRRTLECVRLGKSEPTIKAIQAWRQAVQAGPASARSAAAVDVARRVWEPLRSHLAGAKMVLAAPDGPLCQMPFAALPGKQPGSHLIEELAIGYVLSGRHATALLVAEPLPKSAGVLAVGGIAYGADMPQAPATASNRAAVVDETPRAGFHDLPGTKQEAEIVLRAYGQAFPRQRAPLLLTGTEATEGRLKQELSPSASVQSWRFVHFAGHGFFAPPTGFSVPNTPDRDETGLSFLADRERQIFSQNPLLLSGLVLAGGVRRHDFTTEAPSLEDGILTAEEVYGLDLRGTELVVLSACDTGQGKIAGGEGVLGLQRAFHVAGTRTVIASLWKVDDKATQALMAEFYRNLWEKKHGKLKALREAQLTMLRHYDPKKGLSRGPGEELSTDPTKPTRPGAGERVPPFFWAAFTLSGDWR